MTTRLQETWNTSLRAVLTRFALAFGAGGVRKVSAFAVMILIARRVPAEGFGTAVLAASLIAVLIGLADAGQRALGWRELSAAPSSGATATSVRAALTTKLVCGIGLWLLLVPASLIVSRRHELLAILLVAYGVVLLANDTTSDWILASRGRFRELAGWMMIGAVIEILPVALFVRSSEHLWIVPAALALSYALPSAIIVHEELRNQPAVDAAPRESLFTRLRAGKSLAIGATLFRAAAQINVILVGFALGATETAMYRSAQAVWVLAIWASLTCALPLFARISQLSQRDGRQGSSDAAETILFSVSLLIGGFTLLSLVAIPLAQSALGLIYGEKYRAAAEILRILLVGLPVTAASAFLREVGASANLDRLAYNAGVVILIVTGVLLIPLAIVYGTPGAAWAVNIAEVSGLIAAFYTIQRSMPPLRVQLLKQLRLAATCLAISSVQWWLAGEAHSYTWVVAALGIFISSLLVIRGVPRMRGALALESTSNGA